MSLSSHEDIILAVPHRRHPAEAPGGWVNPLANGLNMGMGQNL